MARSKSLATVTIANAAALSGAVNLGDKVLTAIQVSAAWTTAALSFQASDDGGTTWFDMYDDGGNEITIASGNVAAGRRISLDPSAFAGIDCIKVRSGTTGSPVNQGGARVLTLVSRKFYALD